MAAKFYYTVRELSHHAVELFAFRALTDEIYAGGDPYDSGSGGGWNQHGGGAWLHQHLITDYAACWQNPLANGEWDQVIKISFTNAFFDSSTLGYLLVLTSPCSLQVHPCLSYIFSFHECLFYLHTTLQAICDDGTSRILNYYIEGLHWSVTHAPFIDGIYYVSAIISAHWIAGNASSFGN